MPMHGDLHVESVVVGLFEVNCYVAWRDPAQAIVIDPGAEPKKIRQFLRENNLTVACYFLTHGHADHAGALADVHRRFQAPVAMSSEDLGWAFLASNVIHPFYPAPQAPHAKLFRVDESKPFTFGGLNGQIIETPGHTVGSICLYLADDKVLFPGDTLFKGSVGRTDLPGGNARTLSDSLQKLEHIPPDVAIYPGHGEPTTMGEELKNNYFLQNAG